MDVPAEIARREARLSAIAKAKSKIEQRAAERHQLEQHVTFHHIQSNPFSAFRSHPVFGI
jgi:hypothetical protein